MRLCSYCRSNENTPKNMLEVTSKLNSMTLQLSVFLRCLLWLVIIDKLHIEALSQENRVLKYNINLLVPFPKRESRWVKETGSWIHEKKKKTKENSKDKGSYSTSDYTEVKCDKLVSFILILCSVNNSIVQFDGFSFQEMQERDKRNGIKSFLSD